MHKCILMFEYICLMSCMWVKESVWLCMCVFVCVCMCVFREALLFYSVFSIDVCQLICNVILILLYELGSQNVCLFNIHSCLY